MTTAPDVVIVGGGVVGAACACQLAEAGRRVRVIERGGSAGEAWRASAGMLAPQIEVPVDDLLFELGIAGREYYSEHAAALRDTTGIDIGLWEGGILQVAADEAEVETLKARVGSTDIIASGSTPRRSLAIGPGWRRPSEVCSRRATATSIRCGWSKPSARMRCAWGWRS